MVAPAGVILHAGFHKTGTTSLQRTIEANSASLAPFAHIATLANTPDLRPVAQTARAFSVSQDPLELAYLRGLWAGWLAELRLQKGQTLIVSTEDFSGHMPGAKGLHNYAAAAVVATCLQGGLRSVYPNADLHLIYTTRAPDAWLQSLYWQLSKHAQLTDDFAAFCGKLAGAADLAGAVAVVAAAIGPVPVLNAPLEEYANRRLGPAEAVLDLLELPDSVRLKLQPVPRANQRRTDDLAAAFVALNRLGLMKDDLRARKAALMASAQG